MPKALILSLADSEVGRWLGAIRQLADEASRSDPHITVRYPIQRIGRDAMSSSRDVKISSAVIMGPGYFRRDDGSVSVIYLSCSSELLESFSYKPDFPDSVFHLTLYEGAHSEFSERLFALLSERPWRLRMRLSPPARLEEITVGSGAKSRKRRERFTPEVVDALVSLDLRYASARSIETLPESKRLEAIALVVDHLHGILERVDGDEREESIHPLRQGLRRPQEQSLWTSAPVAVGGSNRIDVSRLRPQEARGGNLVLTPPELVEDMVRYGLRKHRHVRIDFGDPALGNGIFFAVLTRLAVGRHQIASASAVEINRDRAKTAAKRWSNRGLEVLVGDFLTAVPERKWNFVLTNPPYVRSQDIDDAVKDYAQATIKESLGLQVSRRANLFIYFLLRCHDWLSPGATSAWLIPADFAETGYGSVLREYLATRVQLLRLHTYGPNELRFENVRVSPAVVVFRNSKPRRGSKAVISRGGSITKPNARRDVPVEDLADKTNWRLIASGMDHRRQRSDGTVRLGDIFRIRRGIATGANHFFVIDEEALGKHGFETAELRPLLPRPRYMPRDGIVRARKDGSPKVQPRLFVIDSADDLTTLAKKAPNLATYLEKVPPDVRNRHLVSRRSPFYKQESRPPSRLIASNMGQYAGDEHGPVRFFLNLSSATVLNNYLVLYPRSTQEKTFSAHVARKLFELLLSIDPEEYRIWGREYSGGMYKLEPRELAQVRLSVSQNKVASLLDSAGKLLSPQEAIGSIEEER